MNRLKEKYNNEIVPSLREKYNYTSIMEVPKLDKMTEEKMGKYTKAMPGLF